MGNNKKLFLILVAMDKYVSVSHRLITTVGSQIDYLALSKKKKSLQFFRLACVIIFQWLPLTVKSLTQS